ncbi:YjzC family protein [Peribacillus kribbensis]|uniref:YjzC family protein n=1 Tax=Peribacillus kribbensis TaxID=356658 RepID=UPI00041AE2F6|nr:YjzC family protein [Peribacillus kribbensis]
MTRLVKPGEIARVTGTYAESGQGGGKVKGGKRIVVNKGELLPELKTFSIALQHKGQEKKHTRQHRWKLL